MKPFTHIISAAYLDSVGSTRDAYVTIPGLKDSGRQFQVCVLEIRRAITIHVKVVPNYGSIVETVMDLWSLLRNLGHVPLIDPSTVPGAVSCEIQEGMLK